MNFALYFETREDHVILLPTISVGIGRCECCGEPGGYAVTLDFWMWSMGFTFDFGGPHQH